MYLFQENEALLHVKGLTKQGEVDFIEASFFFHPSYIEIPLISGHACRSRAVHTKVWHF